MKESNVTQSASNRSTLPHQRFDIVAKDTIYTFPEDVIQFLMQESDIEFLEHLESEFTTVEARQMDSLIKVLLNGEQVLVHCEFQTNDSTHLEMVRRNIGYLGRCYERYGLPTRNNLLLDLWVMSGLVHQPQAIANFFPEDIMQESSVYQYIIEKGKAEGIEQGIEQGKQLGAKESTIENILLLLDTRFEVNTAQVLKPALEAVDDLQRLKGLFREAAVTQSLESFISNLIINGDAK